MTDGPTVVVADDDELIRSGLTALLGARGLRVVGSAADGRAALDAVALHRPDVLLLDLRMPGLDGLAVVREIARRGLATRVLVLTTFDLDEYVRAALSAGAAGFLLKSVTPDRLADAVRAAARGERTLAPALTERLIGTYLGTPPAGIVPQALSCLTPRELEVFRLMALGLTNDEIRDRLVVSEATVKTHVNRIFRKLRLTSRARAAVMGYESGLLRPGENP